MDACGLTSLPQARWSSPWRGRERSRETDISLYTPNNTSQPVVVKRSFHPRVFQQHLEAGASIWRKEQAGLDQTNHLGPFSRRSRQAQQTRGKRTSEHWRQNSINKPAHQHLICQPLIESACTTNKAVGPAHGACQLYVRRSDNPTPLTSGDRDTPQADRRSPSLSSTATT